MKDHEAMSNAVHHYSAISSKSYLLVEFINVFVYYSACSLLMQGIIESVCRELQVEGTESTRRSRKTRGTSV